MKEYRIERYTYTDVEKRASKYMNRVPEDEELCTEDVDTIAVYKNEADAVKEFSDYYSELREYGRKSLSGEALCDLIVYELFEYSNSDEEEEFDSIRLIAKSQLDEETAVSLDVEYGYYQCECIAEMNLKAKINYIKYDLYVTCWYNEDEEERYDIDGHEGLTEQELENYLTNYNMDKPAEDSGYVRKLKLTTALMEKCEEMRNDGVTDIKNYEIAFQSVINSLYPDKCWWQVTGCDIFMHLLEYKLPELTVSDIVNKLKYDADECNEFEGIET